MEFLVGAWLSLSHRILREILKICIVWLCTGRSIELLLRLIGDSWLFDHPVKYKVILKALSVEQVFKQFTKVCNVRLLLELKRPAIAQVQFKLLWHSLCQLVDLGAQFLVADLLIFLLLGSCWQSLPWQLALVKVD